MAANWFSAVAPYLPEIIRLARPMFTRRPPAPDDSLQRRLELVDTQIVELQNAAGQNADAIAKLASDIIKVPLRGIDELIPQHLVKLNLHDHADTKRRQNDEDEENDKRLPL